MAAVAGNALNADNVTGMRVDVFVGKLWRDLGSDIVHRAVTGHALLVGQRQ